MPRGKRTASTRILSQTKKLNFSDDIPSDYTGQVICPNGTVEWYQDGLLHRDNDKPAVINADGTKAHYQKGLIHRDGDKPAVIGGNGLLEYRRFGHLHREDGPARVEGEGGCEAWYWRGKLHREDGPAVVWPSGHGDWWLEGTRYKTKEDWEVALVKLRNHRIMNAKPARSPRRRRSPLAG